MAIPLALFLSNFILRLSLIGKGPYHYDCFQLAVASQDIIKTHQLHYLQGSGLPLTALLGAGAAFFTRPASLLGFVFSANMLSVLFSSLTIALFYIVVVRLFDKTSALIAAICLSFHPLFFLLSTFGNSHMPAAFFFLLTLALLLSDKKNVLLAGVAFGLLGAARLQDWVAVLLPMSYLVAYGTEAPATPRNTTGQRDQLKTKELIIFLAVSIVISFLFYLPALTAAPNPLQSHSFLDRINANIFNPLAHFSIRSLYKHGLFLFSSLPLLGWAVVLYGLLRIFQTGRKTFLFLILTLILPLILYAGLTISRPRYFLLSVFPLLIAQGFALAHIVPNRKRLQYVIWGLVAVSVLGQFLTTTYPTAAFRHYNSSLIDFYKMVKEKTPTNALVFDADHGSIVSNISQREFKNLYLGSYHPQKEKLREFFQLLHTRLSEGQPVYITTFAIDIQPRRKILFAILNRYFQIDLIDKRTVDDWHHHSTQNHFTAISLYKITSKNNPDIIEFISQGGLHER